MTSRDLPFTSRPLTSSELSRYDIFMTAKPGSNEIVALVDPIRLAQWLLLMFDRHCTECVERPRKLTLHNEVSVELDFWTRHRDGSEMFWVIVSEKDSHLTLTGRVHRDATLWSQAAAATGIPLTFVHESQVLQRGQRAANFFRLLPHVQAAYQLPQIANLRERVRELAVRWPLAMTFEQIENSLPDLDRAAVRATLCSFIFEGVMTFEEEIALTERTLLTWSEFV